MFVAGMHMSMLMLCCGSHACSTSDLPNFFASTKFFACLDLLESQELFEATQIGAGRSCDAPPACLDAHSNDLHLLHSVLEATHQACRALLSTIGTC